MATTAPTAAQPDPGNLGTDQVLPAAQHPLCVDLDGTLLHTDVLVESLLGLLKINIMYLLLVPVWLLRGRANLKAQIANRVELDPALLPYNEVFLAYLREQQRGGRVLILCTGTNTKYAAAIAAHLGLFTEIIASDERRNLTGRVKSEILTQRFGKAGFDYAGNARPDLAIWANARGAITVNCGTDLVNRVSRLSRLEQSFPAARLDAMAVLKAIRAYQWSKNLLVFVPLLASHQFTSMQSLEQALLGFLAFCLCASGVYVVNDLLDLNADRLHPRKRRRPFAAGTISPAIGLACAPLLLLAAVLLTRLLPQEFLALLSCYVIISFTYTLFLKRIPILDALVLAGLYTLRILAGAAAITVETSFWLLSFSMFFFLSIALAKRYSELLDQNISYSKEKSGRRYRPEDIHTLISQGASSGHVAVLVLALYINSDEVLLHYKMPMLLWFICPLLLYWISKLWLNAQRQEISDDPLVWAITNRVSIIISTFCVIIFLLAFYLE